MDRSNFIRIINTFQCYLKLELRFYYTDIFYPFLYLFTELNIVACFRMEDQAFSKKLCDY